MNLSWLTEANRGQSQIISNVFGGYLVFKEVLHEWQSLANRRGGGWTFSKTVFVEIQ